MFNILKTKNFSGVACMYACMLEHPHHFDQKKKRKKENEKREREASRPPAEIKASTSI